MTRDVSNRSFFLFFLKVPWNFVKFNIIKSVGLEYGIHGWHWYFTNCFPALLGPWIPVFLIGCISSFQNRSHHNIRILVEYIIWGLLSLSISGHKELRFALPLLPVAHIIIGFGLSEIKDSSWKSFYIRFAICVNIFLAFYLSSFHQAASVQVMDFLAKQENIHAVDFYTRCHATPYWSHVHRTDIRQMRFLDCSPAVDELRYVPSMANKILYGKEEEDEFMEGNQEESFRKRFEKWTPSHVVVASDVVHENGRAWLETRFTKCATFKHTFSIDYYVYCPQK